MGPTPSILQQLNNLNSSLNSNLNSTLNSTLTSNTNLNSSLNLTPNSLCHQNSSPFSSFPTLSQPTNVTFTGLGGAAANLFNPASTNLSLIARRRKARTVFSDAQLNGLEARFLGQRYLSTGRIVGNLNIGTISDSFTLFSRLLHFL